MSNPKDFVRQAHRVNVRYEYLLEAFACMGQQAMSRLFVGKSSRGSQGTLSAATLLNWKATFEFARDNPEKEDNDPYQARSMEKNGKGWDQFVQVIRERIQEPDVEIWDHLPLKKLGDEAIRWGMTVGVRNTKSLSTLLPRMKEMVERRRANLWEADVIDENGGHEKDYRLMNIFQLREIAKKNNISQYGKKKEELILALQNPVGAALAVDGIAAKDYSKMSMKHLKALAKERGMSAYNNLNLVSLRQLHEEFDALEREETLEASPLDNATLHVEEAKEYSLTLPDGSNCIIPIQKNGMVNATLLCQAGGKFFKDYLKNKQTELYLEALESDRRIIQSDLIIVKKGNSTKFTQGTWVHRLIAIDLARWISPTFAVQMTKWLDELFTTGKVELQRPIRMLVNLSERDIEAEHLEMKHEWCRFTNRFVLYIAYIGDGLVKVGSSDCKIEKRLEKHQGTESQYPQFRVIGAFLISGRCVENTIHCLLERYRSPYNKQKEVFRPAGSLTAFLQEIENLLLDNDLRLQLDLARERIHELEKDNLSLRLQLLQDKL